MGVVGGGMESRGSLLTTRLVWDALMACTCFLGR